MKFNKLHVGQNFTFEKIISSDIVESFSELSGDKNPIHLDDEYAANTFFKRKIIHGMIVGSLFSKVIANDLPGEGSIYINQTLDFKKPIYHNQKLKISVTIETLKQEKQVVILATQCYVDGNLAVDGKAVVKKIDL